MNSLVLLSVFGILALFLGLNKTTAKFVLPSTLAGLGLAFIYAIVRWDKATEPIYRGMLFFDNYAVAFSAIAIALTALIFLLSKGYFERISAHIAEYHAIILFALAGIVVMVSYYNLVMLFIGIEIMSVSLYILAGIRKKDFASNEAALKYFLMGAFSTGFLLFGIALVYGTVHSFDFTEIISFTRNAAADHRAISPMFYTGIMLILVGLCFKVGAAPFHFWTPDVYEGSPTLITLFMSTVVKVAGFAAFLRLFSLCFAPMQYFWMPALLGITGLSLLVGNVTALYQQNFKRMLGWSSISHAGYMLFAVLTVSGTSGAAVFLYAIAYSAASVIAFAGLILVRRRSGSDSFDSFNGLARTNPFLALCITVAMLSLAGIPLTAGFIGKFIMFSNALESYHTYLVIFAVINAVIGIFYYFRVIVAMYFKDGFAAAIRVPVNYTIVLVIALAATLIVGIWPGFLPTTL